MRRPDPARIAALVASMLVLAGCAEVAPPPGGPPDLVPPRVLAAFPESLATGVDSAATLSLTFSEKVDRRSVREWIVINPYRPISWAKWSGPTVRFRLQGGLPADTTIQVTLGSGVRDRAGLPLQPSFSRLLTRGSSIAPGVIAGRIRASRLGGTPAARKGADEATGQDPDAVTGGAPAAGKPKVLTQVPRLARFIWLFRVGGDTLPDPRVETPYWVGEADPEGNFRLEGLPLDVPFHLLTLYDADRSRSPEGLADYWSFEPDTLRLTESTPRQEDRTVFLVDPKSPGRISGRLVPVADTTIVDTTVIGVLAASRPAGVDSLVMTWPPTSVTRATRVDASGAWILAGMPPARYRLAAWRDRNRNGQLDADEPIGAWMERTVRADEDVTDCELARPAGP